jgi:hypothetical protein
MNTNNNNNNISTSSFQFTPQSFNTAFQPSGFNLDTPPVINFTSSATPGAGFVFS